MGRGNSASREQRQELTSTLVLGILTLHSVPRGSTLFTLLVIVDSGLVGTRLWGHTVDRTHVVPALWDMTSAGRDRHQSTDTQKYSYKL